MARIRSLFCAERKVYRFTLLLNEKVPLSIQGSVVEMLPRCWAESATLFKAQEVSTKSRRYDSGMMAV